MVGLWVADSCTLSIQWQYSEKMMVVFVAPNGSISWVLDGSTQEYLGYSQTKAIRKWLYVLKVHTFIICIHHSKYYPAETVQMLTNWGLQSWVLDGSTQEYLSYPSLGIKAIKNDRVYVILKVQTCIICSLHSKYSPAETVQMLLLLLDPSRRNLAVHPHSLRPYNLHQGLTCKINKSGQQNFTYF